MTKSFHEHIRDARGSNIVRIVFSFIFLFSFYLNGYFVLSFFSLVHISVATWWFWLIERRYFFYHNRPNLWYLPATLDIINISASVFVTGIAYSPATLGYVIVTAFSSTDTIQNRGKYSAYVSSISFLTMNSLAYFHIVPIFNILTEVTFQITTFSYILSSLLVSLVCLVTNSVISSIYLQLNEKNIKLSESLTKINELKLQQDGDYYLTSLLLEPLASNLAESKRVQIEFSIRQYKRFIFRDFMNELGGDICLADSIHIQGKKYIIVVNGDAMGKSMQGAGGALVLGVVLKSIITRSQLLVEEQNITPYVWLEHCFRELNEVFYSFEGYMLVSVFISLLEEDTGILYFVNAEHPRAVLFRNGQASFIPNDDRTRKIGTLGEGEQVRVEIFPLQSGDELFIGSDGKDDLVVGKTEAGERQIGSDDDIFLKLIEKYSGNLEQAVTEIENQFELTDDFSVIKIRFL